MIRNVCLPILAVWALAGCVTVVEMPDLPLTHPANPLAEAPPALPPPATLSLHYPAPDISPEDSAAQHDHMQQGGHGKPEMEGMGEGGSMQGMSSNAEDAKPMRKMQHGPHGPGVQPHSHEAENAETQHGPMHGRAQSGRVYRCPIHLEAVSAYAGNCMRCNRVLEPHAMPAEKMDGCEKAASGGLTSSAYFCTVHPTLPLESPGLCPVCGMTVIKREEMNP